MILVTGGTGLVGAHLLYELTKTNDVVKAIYRTEKSLQAVENVFSFYTENASQQFAKIEWILADVTDIPSLEIAFVNVTKVYHCAALVSFDSKKYKEMRRVNIDGTANIVNFCVSHKVKKICFVSSIAAVGNALHNAKTTEENEWNVETDSSGYSITKYGAEMEVWRGSQEGVDVVIVNPGIILGPGFWHVNSGEFFTKVANSFKFYTEGITGYVGVDDVVNAMVLLMESAVKSERFVLVSENKSFKEIFDVIAKNLQKTTPTIKVSKNLTAFLWRLDWLASILTNKGRAITKKSANSLHSKTFYSSNKIKKTLNFEFVSVEKVIEKTCSFFPK